MDERDEHSGAPATNGASRRGGSMSPVLRGTEARAIARPQLVVLPAPVVAAAGGAVFGALTVFLLRLARRPGRPQTTTVRIGGGKRRGRRGALEVAASRSFLVDVHMLKR
jgi:hypothetical protein